MLDALDLSELLVEIKHRQLSEKSWKMIEELVEHRLKAYQNWKAGAAKSRCKRTHKLRIESGIREAADPLPLTMRGLANAVERRIARHGAIHYGLVVVPSLPTIRRVLRLMAEEQVVKNKMCNSVNSVSQTRIALGLGSSLPSS